MHNNVVSTWFPVFYLSCTLHNLRDRITSDAEREQAYAQTHRAGRDGFSEK